MAEHISLVDVLVHPDFHPIYCSRVLDSLQSELRQKWDDRALEQAKNSRSALLYIAAWEQRFPESQAMQEDLDRTKRYQGILGNRLVVNVNYRQPTAKVIHDRFAANGLVVAPNAEIYVYGEYRQVCVAAMYDRMADIFPNGKRSILEDLCRPK